MTEIAVVALIVARPGEGEKLRAVLEGIVEPTRSEPGALQYDLHRDLKEPARFVFVERWALGERGGIGCACGFRAHSRLSRGGHGLDRELGDPRVVEARLTAGRPNRPAGGRQCDVSGTSRIRMIVQSASPS